MSISDSYIKDLKKNYDAIPQTAWFRQHKSSFSYVDDRKIEAEYFQFEHQKSIISNIVNLFNNAVKKNEDLVNTFTQTLNILAEAQKVFFPPDEEFSVLPRDRDPFSGPWAIYSIEDPSHKEHLYAIIKSTIENIKKISPQLKISTSPLKADIKGNTWNGILSSIRLYKISNTLMEQTLMAFSPEDLRTIFKICQIPFCEDELYGEFLQPTVEEKIQALLSDRENIEKLKNQCKKLYKKIKMNVFTSEFERPTTKNKSLDWIILKFCLGSENSKLNTLSHFITRISFDRKGEKYTLDPKIVNISQDAFLINKTLAEAAQIFKEALEWDGEDLQKLKSKVALIQYSLAHCRPYIDGSEKIADWMEMGIYRYHKLSVGYTYATSTVEKLALTNTLDAFFFHYDTIVSIIPK